MTNTKELFTRGVEKAVGIDQLESLLQSGEKLRIKYGVDPTSKDLHLGNAALFGKLKQFQDLGHKVIFLIGDFTARFGDPDKLKARKMRSKAEVREMAKKYVEQAGKIMDLKKTEVVYNGDWYDKMSAEDLLKIQWNFTYNQLIERDMFQERIKKELPIHYPELGYPILQGYDSVHLKADLAVCGSDQLFNEMQGRVIQSKMGQKPQAILALKLLIGTDGQKMSQSIGNVISIDEEPAEMFGKVMSIPDAVMGDYLEALVRLPMKEIERIKTENADRQRELKAFLAKEIVKNYHGEKAAQMASESFNRIFRDKEMPSEIAKIKISKKEMPIIDLLIEAELAPSRGAARRLVEQGGVRIDSAVIGDINAVIGINSKMIIQVGKRKFVEVE